MLMVIEQIISGYVNFELVCFMNLWLSKPSIKVSPIFLKPGDDLDDDFGVQTNSEIGDHCHNLPSGNLTQLLKMAIRSGFSH